MERLDWIALAVVAFAGFVGWRKGLLASGLAIVGIVAGAVIGARLAPSFLGGGSHSAYAPLVALGGAVICASFLEAMGSTAGSFFRSGLRFTPLRALDSAGGLVLGGAAGLAFVWVVGAAALLLPGQPSLRKDVQRSEVIQRLNEIVPPGRLLNAIATVDPFPSIAGPPIPGAPTSAIARDARVRAASASVVRVLGTACGLGIAGSGWVAAPGLVVTAAHVVAGERATVVEDPVNEKRLDAQAVAFDPKNDIAVLRVQDLPAKPLAMVEPEPSRLVGLVGYPLNGPLTVTPGRIGKTAHSLTDDAYGHGPVDRLITSLSGTIRHGNSGGPAIDSDGHVQATVFATKTDGPGGYAIPGPVVRKVLAGVTAETVATGACAP